MKKKKMKFGRDDGWTLVEAILSMLIMSIMVLGLSIVLMAFKEHIDRSLAVRMMDQYGNNVIEQLTHKLRNAVNVVVRNGIGNTNRIDIEFLDPISLNFTIWEFWKMEGHSIVVNNRRLDPHFPPFRLGRGEFFEIRRFTMTPYGLDTPNEFERVDHYLRSDSFNKATWDIRFVLRYTRNPISQNGQKWVFEKEYHNRVYMRNMNLIIQQGIIE